jgi:hypothetical protein
VSRVSNPTNSRSRSAAHSVNVSYLLSSRCAGCVVAVADCGQTQSPHRMTSNPRIRSYSSNSWSWSIVCSGARVQLSGQVTEGTVQSAGALSFSAHLMILAYHVL